MVSLLVSRTNSIDFMEDNFYLVRQHTSACLTTSDLRQVCGNDRNLISVNSYRELFSNLFSSLQQNVVDSHLYYIKQLQSLASDWKIVLHHYWIYYFFFFCIRSSMHEISSYFIHFYLMMRKGTAFFIAINALFCIGSYYVGCTCN